MSEINRFTRIGWPIKYQTEVRVWDTFLWLLAMLVGSQLSRSFSSISSTAPLVKCFFEPVTGTAQYIVSCPNTKKAVIIDSVLDFCFETATTSATSASLLLDYIHTNQLDVSYILETHVHADHITAANYLKKELKTPKTCISAGVVHSQKKFSDILELDIACDGSQFDMLLSNGEKLECGTLTISVLETSGHTPSCLSFLVNNHSIFVGDTFFMPDSGTARCDFPGGSSNRQWESLQKILALPEDTKVFVGHDYRADGKRNFQWESSVAEQRSNILLAGKNEAEYIEGREAKDKTLPAPRLLYPSLQYNLLGGKPPAFVKLPTKQSELIKE